jgi:four helix bundle protein
VVAEEADESVYWLELLRDAEIMSDSKIGPLLNEANELTAIFTSSRRTSSRNQTSNIKPQK